MNYTTRHIAEMFSIGISTVKNYCETYGEFLTPEATPTQQQALAEKKKWKHRVFTVEDVKTFSLIVDYRKRGIPHDEIFLALKNDVRGELPPTHVEVSLAVQSREQVIMLQNRVQQLEAQLMILKDEHDRAIKLEALLEDTRRQLKERSEELKAAYIEIGKLST